MNPNYIIIIYIYYPILLTYQEEKTLQPQIT